MLKLFAAALVLLSAPVIAAERIVTLAPSLTELVCAVGACDRLVGVDVHSDYPAAALKVTRIGDAFQFNVEKIIALKPDVVLAWRDGNNATRVAQLTRLGLRVEWVRANRLDDIGNALLQVGTLVNQSANAARAAADYRFRLARLRARPQPEKPLGAFYQIEVQPLYTVNRQSPISEAMALCGARNIFADLSQIAGIVNVESVIARNPSLILHPREIHHGAVKALWQRWPTLRAVQVDAIVPIEDSLLARATPRMLDGVEHLCAIVDRTALRLKAPRS